MTNLPFDWELWLNETVDVSDPAGADLLDASDATLCAGPFLAPGPISSERLQELQPERTIDNLYNLAPNVGSSIPGLSSSLDVNFGFNSNLHYGSQNPSFPFVVTTGNFPLANNNPPLPVNAVNPLPVPGDLTDFDLPSLTQPSYSSSASLSGPSSNVPSLGSIPTQPTSRSLSSQADNQQPRRLPLPVGLTSNFKCSVCASNFALGAQLRYVS